MKKQDNANNDLIDYKTLNSDIKFNEEFNIEIKNIKYDFFSIFPSIIFASIVGGLLAAFFNTGGELFTIIIIAIVSLFVFHYSTFVLCEEKFVNQNKANIDNIKNKENTFKKIYYYNNIINDINISLKNNLAATINYSANLISDIEAIKYELSAQYLETKSHPAHKKAEDVRELKQKTKEYIKEYKLMRYEYDMLFSLFPELENYLEYYSAEKSETIEEVKENYDYVQSWISKDEYSSLDENTRNQLALDRYIESRKKSKWAIGRDYEMFIGHEYEKKGYKVTYTGITDRLEDKGRDLIAQKDNEILIIQCKNWSKYKEIHENHICQLFGTTVQYNIENNLLFKATPVFVTSATLSETALRFAEYLGVQVIQNKKLEEFPRIKCNINNKEKIYHLPFDQQYDRTIIGDQKGEFFAWTVQEAVNKGFRRAKKYFYIK